jgi:hypothetical protein
VTTDRPLARPTTIRPLRPADLAGLGIAPECYATRMWLGAPPLWRADMVFGVFNFGVA